MLDKTLLLMPIDQLRIFFINNISVYHIAIVYVLTYVLYKALGRYIYFKTQEHASKINRTFLTLAILVILISFVSNVSTFLPFIDLYRWLYIFSTVVIILAVPLIILDRWIWNYNFYNKIGRKSPRAWHQNYLRIYDDYFKTSTTKYESDGHVRNEYEDEVVKSTSDNISSDIFINLIAILIFIAYCAISSVKSFFVFGVPTFIYSIPVCILITAFFVDNAVFSWVKFLEDKIRVIRIKSKSKEDLSSMINIIKFSKISNILLESLPVLIMVALIPIIRNDYLLALAYIFIIAISLKIRHAKNDAVLFTFGFFAMIFFEYIFISTGVETFVRNSLFGLMPIWLPLLWGYGFVAIKRGNDILGK